MRLPSVGLRIALGILVVCAALPAVRAWGQPATTGALGTPAPEVDEKIQEVADAKTRFLKGDFPGALDLLQEAVKKNPDRLPPAQLIMGLWYGQIKQGAAALASFEKAISDDPADPEAYIVLGEVEFQANRWTAAGLLFEKAFEVTTAFTKSPTRKKVIEPRVYGGLAAAAEARASMVGDDEARAKKEWITAQGYLEAWLKLEISGENRAVALQRLARALFKQKTRETVVASLEKLKEAKKANPNVQSPYVTLAGYYQQENDFKNAKTYMDYALKDSPEDLNTRKQAARWCLQTMLLDPGQLALAREHAAKATRLDPADVDAMILRGVVALFEKEYEPAERYFQLAQLKAPNSFAAANNMALALCEQDEAKRRTALGYAERNWRLNQQGDFAAEAASTMGWILYKSGQIAQADKVLSQLIRSARVNEDTLYYAAQVAFEARPPRVEEATQLVQRALSSKQPFSMRPEAQRLIEQLQKAKSGSR